MNGYEFTEHTNGALNIRLQQFDAGYQYFTISAMDNAGNISEIYKTANPYYTDPETKDSNEKDPAEQLPVDASATKPSSATAQVTEHTNSSAMGIPFPRREPEQALHPRNSLRVQETPQTVQIKAVKAVHRSRAKSFIRSRLLRKRCFIL